MNKRMKVIWFYSVCRPLYMLASVNVSTVKWILFSRFFFFLLFRWTWIWWI